MALDMFLKLDGIPGDSVDDKHKGEIVLESFSWGETNTVAHGSFTGGGATAGRVSLQDFHFTSRVSKASPKLMLACANGQHILNGVVTVRKAGGENQFEFLFYKFTNVIITSVQDAGANSDVVPLESVSFAFQKINVEFKEQQPATGAAGAAVDFAWDLVANRKA